jgi:hypothetical protein
MRMIFFMDPVSGWIWWTPPLPVEAEPPGDGDSTGVSPRPAGQGLIVRLLGRAGAWFGICEQTPSGRWRRLRVARRDPWEPGARRHHCTVWSWWCP